MTTRSACPGTGAGRGVVDVLSGRPLPGCPPPIRDWEAEIRWARRHGVLGCLEADWERAVALGAPADRRPSLAEECRGLTARNLFLAGELARLGRLLQSREIPVLALKGPALAMQLDGHLCRRAFDDLDLLVPPQCLVRAKALLQEEGFAPFRHADGAIGLCGPRGLIVELHWAFSPKHERFPLPVRQVMERAGVVDVAGYWTPFQRPRTCCSCFASTERSTPGSGSSGSATSDGCWKHAPGSPGPKCGSDRAGCAAAECCWWA